jgi:hypothetical protein
MKNVAYRGTEDSIGGRIEIDAEGISMGESYSFQSIHHGKTHVWENIKPININGDKAVFNLPYRLVQS